jgi:ankyrin repeat protein
VTDQAWLEAAQQGDAVAVAAALADSRCLPVRDPEGQTAFHLAARAGHVAVVLLLLGHGAAPGTPSVGHRSSWPPL